MSSLPISNDNEYLSIDSLGRDTVESIREIIKLEGVLHWNRQGEVRVVPLAVLMDTFETYDFWASAPDSAQVDAPEHVGRVYWADTQRLIQTQPEL